MPAPTMAPAGPMIDVQNERDTRNIPINKVGVKGVKYPITVLDRAQGTQAVSAAINMYVNLPHHFKATHEPIHRVLNEFRGRSISRPST